MSVLSSRNYHKLMENVARVRNATIRVKRFKKVHERYIRKSQQYNTSIVLSKLKN